MVGRCTMIHGTKALAPKLKHLVDKVRGTRNDFRVHDFHVRGTTDPGKHTLAAALQQGRWRYIYASTVDPTDPHLCAMNEQLEPPFDCKPGFQPCVLGDDALSAHLGADLRRLYDALRGCLDTEPSKKESE
eukprot:TRINITY_DN6467_c0_g1_i7.p3 TRINITY_DN6467_c0_g1~~TRINITY_DN6467_c0_g1_i7.p3  ORF type:complete len:131 (-),score=13.47 TRINITY_DN6467_c0_g1_i7:357-749(-)